MAVDFGGLTWLMAGAAFLIFSVGFLLHANRTASHDHSRGADMVTIIVGLGALFLMMIWFQAVGASVGNVAVAFVQDPRLLFPGVIIPAILLAAFAALKLLTTVITVSRPDSHPAAIGAAVGVINFLASIATLFAFYRDAAK